MSGSPLFITIYTGEVLKVKMNELYSSLSQSQKSVFLYRKYGLKPSPRLSLMGGDGKHSVPLKRAVRFAEKSSIDETKNDQCWGGVLSRA